MKMKTSELSGAALDWAVECIEQGRVIDVDEFVMRSAEESYIKNWAQGGPIIERENLQLCDRYAATAPHTILMVMNEGETDRLPAAMRCYVARELGDEVEVPNELC